MAAVLVDKMAAAGARAVVTLQGRSLLLMSWTCLDFIITHYGNYGCVLIKYKGRVVLNRALRICSDTFCCLCVIHNLIITSYIIRMAISFYSIYILHKHMEYESLR